ncbi:P-loop containing nucleoside triphosphate hydrolase protein [Fomitopsis serialis]|uniref:P-loop containing nucleoside triphosphate hydrolase protein n=1 Tax=Fomitopsis serialis TaxID=139415 RepID=UPI002008961A|nr:P-loop containing nucleoside triphosphate hydrolase protein [Neoantrodia serialis]KAH9937252.1 P-loop containing nucleoside triphosphate hydrolase protein [Neoantrodia serialis]
MPSPGSTSTASHETSHSALPSMQSYSRSNPIDLTLDDDDRDPYQPQDRLLKRPCTSTRSFNASCESILEERARSQSQSSGLTPVMSASAILPPVGQPNISSHLSQWQHHSPFQGPQPPIPSSIRPPPFTGPSTSSAFFPDRTKSESMQRPPMLAPSPSRHGLERSPSPPPSRPLQPQQGNLPPDLPPKTPVCIGQLTVTALVLYPIPYLSTQEHADTEWAPVRLTYEHTPHKAAGSETIHIKTPNGKSPAGEVLQGESFAFVEQKAATFLGPMLGKGLIRLDAKVRRGMPNLPILPLQLLVYTPKGNIPVVANYLQQSGFLLDHPTLPGDIHRVMNSYYYNPHNPPAGGHSRNNHHNGRMGYSGPGGSNMGRWAAPGVPGKSVEIQRSQVDELFKSLQDGEELQETDPPPEIATTLYPHQKKALTFLLERERERPGSGPSGNYSSLWQERRNPITGQRSWLHLITQREIHQEPQEAKSSILADDMGLGKTITCVSLIAVTLSSARQHAATPVVRPSAPPEPPGPPLSADHFAGSVWGMPTQHGQGSCSTSKGKAKSSRDQDREQAGYTRACRIKVRTRATLIVCPLSTVVNWEDQFREHWRANASGAPSGTSTPCGSAFINGPGMYTFPSSSSSIPVKSEAQVPPGRVREGTPLRVYVYHGNARRPDPTFLADFDAVITTYSTLASEFSKQSKSIASAGDDDDEDDNSSDGERLEVDERGNQFIKLSKPKKAGKKRKKCGVNGVEATSPLQSVDWFRVVLDEAHSIKETSTVACRASCDLVADLQNKLDDVFALVKFLRLDPLDDKGIWTEFIGTPVKYGQPLGVARLQTIMKCITLRRTKESTAEDGRKILSLPPRKDELRYLKFDPEEQAIYDQFFTESKAEFNELSNKNEVMKNYVGILQKILRLRQICDHFELVQNKGLGLLGDAQGQAVSYDDIIATVAREGLNLQRATTIFALLKEAGVTQCVECGGELASSQYSLDGGLGEAEGVAGSGKRGRKPKASSSRASTRQNSPSAPHPILTRCQHLFCLGCFRNSVAPGWPNVPQDAGRCCSVCQTGLNFFDVVEVNPEGALPDALTKKKAVKKEKRQKGILMENFHPSTKVKALLSDLMEISRANPYSANYDHRRLNSQWTTMLDKVEDALEVTGIRYSRLDGTMKRDERTRAMDSLKHDPSCEVLLVSLKAGGVGLNLTAAQRVYLMDPYWNPAVENQAVDRIHRLGQTRPVLTVKYIIENSIEDRLLEVQRKKTELANMTLGGSSFSKAEMLQRRMEELNQLFGS